jgi:hypothetical protein
MPAKDVRLSYFSYTDPHGVEVVVDRLADVPEAYRSQAKHIDLSKPALTVRVPPAGQAPASRPTVSLDGASFAIGAATRLVLGLLLVLAARRATRSLGLVAMAFVICLMAMGYFGYLRREAGLSGQGLATPGILLDDARAAAQAMKQRNDEQARALQQLDRP